VFQMAQTLRERRRVRGSDVVRRAQHGFLQATLSSGMYSDSSNASRHDW
jgi:hypothetical protein